MQRRTALTLLALAGAGFGLAACGAGTDGGGARPGGDILAVARANNLDQFLRAVDAADLDATLAGAGPYTVFAPSDAAFRALPRGRFSALLNPSNRDELRAFVGYHIVPGLFEASFLAGLDANYSTAAGRSLNVDGIDGLRVNGARVIRPDLQASNGVVHVVDRVLTPT
jgi:uncharacterized surface protein with fasciclin (FAS1) repeats